MFSFPIIYPHGKDGQASLLNIHLRRFTEKEYHRFFRRYRTDASLDIAPFVYSREQVSRSYLYNHDPGRTDFACYGIFEGEEPVGSFQLKRMDPGRKSCEFGIILRDESVRSRGIGTEAMRLGMEMAREKYGMAEILGDTRGDNLRMRRVFEKLGFEMAERVPGAFLNGDGTREDRLVFRRALTEEDGKKEESSI